MLTCCSASSRVASTEVGGMTADRRLASAGSAAGSRMSAIRLAERGQRDPAGHPAVAELHGQPGRARGGAAVPERDPAADRLGLDRHVGERELVVGVADVVLGEHPAQDLRVGADQLDAVPVAPADGVELVVEGAGAEAEDQPGTDELGDGAGHQRGDQRVAERDQRAGAEFDALGDGADRGERGQRVVERAVGLLHLAVRLEDQVVAHPHRVEAELLGPLRAARAACPGRPAHRSGGAAVRTSWRSPSSSGWSGQRAMASRPVPGSPTTLPSVSTGDAADQRVLDPGAAGAAVVRASSRSGRARRRW